MARECALDEGWRASVRHGDGLPDAGGADSLNVFLLEVLNEDVFRVEGGERGNREENMLFPLSELVEDRLAWQTSPLDGVSVEDNRM